MKRLALALVAVCTLMALGADFIASDRPIVMRWHGETVWFPNIASVHEIDALSGSELRARMTTDDWALWAPVRWSPDQVRTHGKVTPLESPSSIHWLGTDDRGRDVLARLVHGARATLSVVVLTSLLALALGLATALLALGTRLSPLVLASVDLASAVPALLVVVAVQGLAGAGSLLMISTIIAVPRAADVARLAYAAMDSARAQDYAVAAESLGASASRVVFRHLLPAALRPLLISSAITASTAALAEAALSFMGFGVDPPTASWGELLSQAANNDLRWWLVVPCGVVLTSVAAAFAKLAQHHSGSEVS